MATVTIVEVGPRDGLQNERPFIPTADKLRLIGLLADTGLRRIEATAFVSPQWVPQMADHAAVMAAVPKRDGLVYSALVPNEKGAETAIMAGAQELAVFTSASETFAQKNTNCSISDSLARFLPVMRRAEAAGIPVRGYLSCALDCPYEGSISPAAVAEVARQLHDIGCHEIALSDTIGSGTPEGTARMVEAVLGNVPAQALAGHFHDTAGRAVLNVEAALALGIRVFDSSISGLGGCPYAPGAAGNVATETLVEWFTDKGFATGIDHAALAQAGEFARSIMARA